MRDLAGVFIMCMTVCAGYASAQPAAAGSTEQGPCYQGLTPGAFMKQWLVCGPFPVGQAGEDPADPEVQMRAFARDFLDEHGGEAEIRPKVDMVHPIEGQTLTWQVLTNQVNLVNLIAQYGQQDYAVAYAWAEVEMDTAETYLLGIASDDAVKVWLNGKLIHENWTSRPARPDDDLVTAEFNPGRNRLLLKVQTGRELWGFACRRVDPRSLVTRFLPAVKGGDTALVRVCLATGVDLSQTDEYGFTALQLARMHGHQELVQLLLEQGADPNLEMPVAGTPAGFLDLLWGALKENYPMMEYAGAFDERWYDACKAQVEDMNSLFQALPIMDRMLVRRLNDYHTSLHWEGKSGPIAPPILVDWVEDQIVVTQGPQGQQVAPGDIVLAVNEVNARECFNAALVYAFGATPYAKTRSACQNMLAGEPGSKVKLNLRNAQGEEYALTLERGAPGLVFERGSVLSSQVIGEDIGYIKIRAWGGFSAQEFDAALEPLQEKPFLILDVRDNGGGADELAAEVIGRFITQRILCSVSFQRQPGTNTYEKLIHTADPRGPWCYQGKVAVLTNAGCASACEHFVSGMFEAGAMMVGTPTTGACGWSRGIDLPAGVSLRCSLTFPLHGKVPSPLNGMTPHHLVTPTLADIRAGRDTVLEKAIALLHPSLSQ